MTVQELIELLKAADPNARVLCECRSELREVKEEDIQDNSSRDDAEYFTDDGDEITGPVVTIATWS